MLAGAIDAASPGLEATVIASGVNFIVNANWQLLSRLYEHISVLITTNMDFPDVVERLRQSDRAVVAASPDESAARLAADSKTWRAVAKRLSLQPN